MGQILRSIKRITVIALILALALTLVACKSTDYKKATQLYDQGKWDEAITMFVELDDYEDSATMAQLCNYEKSVELYHDQKYEEAVNILCQMPSHEESVKLLHKIMFDFINMDFKDSLGAATGFAAEYTDTFKKWIVAMVSSNASEFTLSLDEDDKNIIKMLGEREKLIELKTKYQDVFSEDVITRCDVAMKAAHEAYIATSDYATSFFSVDMFLKHLIKATINHGAPSYTAAGLAGEIKILETAANNLR